ncbi:hypothetical protein PS1_022008 [Malus domestica]
MGFFCVWCTTQRTVAHEQKILITLQESETIAHSLNFLYSCIACLTQLFAKIEDDTVVHAAFNRIAMSPSRVKSQILKLAYVGKI